MGTESHREPDIVSSYDGGEYDTVGITQAKLQTDYNSMVRSVAQYGGFYVGRYETGIQDGKIVSKNAYETDGVTTVDAKQDDTKRWYGLYEAQKNYATTGSVRSSMIWGSQYDAMMNWMAKTGNTVGTADSNKYNTSTITGSSETDVINNVYDLYGCHYEWTLEAVGTDLRVVRRRCLR